MHILRLKKIPMFLMDVTMCPECGSNRYYTTGKEAFCPICSLVILGKMNYDE